MVVLGSKAQYQRALDKAATKKPLDRVRQVERSSWRIVGDTDTYIVRLTSDGLACVCRAAQNGAPCWHIAAVHIFRASAEAFRADPLADDRRRRADRAAQLRNPAPRAATFNRSTGRVELAV